MWIELLKQRCFQLINTKIQFEKHQLMGGPEEYNPTAVSEQNGEQMW